MTNNHKIEVFLTEEKVKINETVEALENCCTVMASPGMANWVLQFFLFKQKLTHSEQFLNKLTSDSSWQFLKQANLQL